MLQWINPHESFRRYYIHYEDYAKRLRKFVRVVSEIYKKALIVQILNEVALRQVARKRVSFQDRKNENTSKFPIISKYGIRQHSDAT